MRDRRLTSDRRQTASSLNAPGVGRNKSYDYIVHRHDVTTNKMPTIYSN